MTAFRCSYYDRIEWDLVAQWNEWFLSENLYRYFHLSTSHTRSPAYQFLAGALAILAIVVAIAIHDISWPAPNLANILFRFVSQTYTLGFLLLLFLFMNITSVNYNTIAKKSIRSSSPTMSVWAVCVCESSAFVIFILYFIFIAIFLLVQPTSERIEKTSFAGGFASIQSPRQCIEQKKMIFLV